MRDEFPESYRVAKGVCVGLIFGFIAWGTIGLIIFLATR